MNGNRNAEAVVAAGRADEVRSSLTDLVGGTPLVEIHSLNDGPGRVLAKVEAANPLGSVKDRIGRAMILDAEQRGALRPGGEIIEPTSGNTGIALAGIGAARGYRVTLVMPESMSLERRATLRALGAELILTPAEQGMKGAIALAERLAGERRDAFVPRQFENPANPRAHFDTTGPEILAATRGRIDVLVAGVGTGGTITGCTRFLRQHLPDLLTVAVEPDRSPVLSGGEPGPHRIQGIGPGFVPANLDTSLIGEIVRIDDETALATARRAAKEEGHFVGISAGANLAAAGEVARRPEMAGKTIVTFLCDAGDRYFSSDLMAEYRD